MILDISLKRLHHGGQVANSIENDHTVKYVFKDLSLTNKSSTISSLLNTQLEVHIVIKYLILFYYHQKTS